MNEIQVDALVSGAEAGAETGAPYQVSGGDFASGVRNRLVYAGVAGDFGTGLRSRPNSVVVGNFASGMRALATVVGGRGDFATGQRGDSTSAFRRASRSTSHRGSSRWHTPEPVSVSGR
jgi:hypothetical protein